MNDENESNDEKCTGKSHEREERSTHYTFLKFLNVWVVSSFTSFSRDCKIICASFVMPMFSIEFLLGGSLLFSTVMVNGTDESRICCYFKLFISVT